MPPTAEPMPQAPEAATERRQEEAQDQASPMGKVVHLHTAHPRVAIPYVTPGDMFKGARGATSRTPSLRKLTGYGILGGMAVAGALEWPIAVAVGVATEVITREQAARKRAEQAKEQGRQPGTEPPVRTQAAQPGQTAMA
ncbi:hypothetical protein ACFQMH_00450 [Streptomyces viridiviolaceus]|uniref:Uncharacterized protein n=1 Tax=Streptomyces viridiviolaceus TaxID=68282 RepID=A0ABW2DR30_9ACTN|nr:hypothetical protein [Streptomyces viridiviolaceus]